MATTVSPSFIAFQSFTFVKYLAEDRARYRKQNKKLWKTKRPAKLIGFNANSRCSSSGTSLRTTIGAKPLGVDFLVRGWQADLPHWIGAPPLWGKRTATRCTRLTHIAWRRADTKHAGGSSSHLWSPAWLVSDISNVTPDSKQNCRHVSSAGNRGKLKTFGE